MCEYLVTVFQLHHEHCIWLSIYNGTEYLDDVFFFAIYYTSLYI